MTYQSEAEIETVVRGFESCETGADDFKHRDHLVVAIWYLQTMDKETALDRMRDGLLRFLDHHIGDTTKYSEEITSFWIERVAHKLDELGAETPFVEKCNRIVELHEFGPEIYTDKNAD
jgi:hypothetical protein